MVATRGRRKSARSDITLEENKPAENGPAETHSDSLTTDGIEPKEDAQLDEAKDFLTDKASDENFSEIPGEEGEKATHLDNEHLSTPETESDGDNKAGLGENTFENDEIDDQEDMLWGDEDEAFEHDSEDKVLDEYEVSEEEATDEDDEGDEVSEEEATEEDEVSEEEAIKEKNGKENCQEKKGNSEQDVRSAKVKEDGRDAKVKEDGRDSNKDESKASLKNIKKSNESSRKKKGQAGRLIKVDSDDKPESSRKRKVKKRVESMGMVFMCSSGTKKDCYQYRVFGLPENKKNIVEKIYTGMRLFLYDTDLKLMHGIYKAAGPGGYNIEPNAFKSQFPSQVRFQVLENCLPLPEEKFKKVIEQNYFTKTKFDCQLNSEQVKKLCRLFVASSKGRPSKKFGASLKAEKRPIRQESSRRQKTGDKRPLPLREEVRHPERPRKRQRKVVSSTVAPHRRLPPPLPSTIPSSYGYDRALDMDAYRRDPYLERRSPLRDRHGRPLIHIDPYGGVRAPPIERSDRYRDGHDPPLERHYAYSSSRDSHIDGVDPYPRRRDPYGEGSASYLERRDPYRDGRNTYIETRESYRDVRDPYIERCDSLRDRRAPYEERHVPYGDSAHSELYITYRRPPLSDGRDVYRDDRGVELRDSYRRDELRYESDTRNRQDIVSRDPYVSNRERLSYADSLYPAAYPSRAGLYRL
ncbi:DNA-directed RNA polymerase [Salvia divinorum]|uniref:DNA-directed RNA polymerase n=1 Tax=Salvia divinorum TaxID=28513 RepID=A0ABD1HTU0_SALDI